MTHLQQPPEPCTSCKYYFADPRSVNPDAICNCHHPAAPALAKHFATTAAHDLSAVDAAAIVTLSAYTCTLMAAARGCCEIWTDKRDPGTLPPPPTTDTPTQQRAPQSPHNRRKSRR